MEAKELRIGNYVIFRNEYFFKKEKVGKVEVRQITNKTVGINHVNFGDLIAHDFDISEIEPMPIDSDFLSKLGFVCVQENEIWQKICNGTVSVVHYFGYKDKFMYGFGSSPLLYFQHVHQLQNIYFAVTGEELTFG